MIAAAKSILDVSQSIHMLPRWVTSVRGQDTDSVVFSSGAALAMLDVVLRYLGATLPGALLRDRLALDVGVACLKLEGRNESASDIRDAVCLARPVRLGWAGDALWPAGEMFVAWRKLARVNLAASGWKDRVRKVLPAAVVEAMPDFGSSAGTPVAQESQILSDMLRQFPREDAAVLMLTDLMLASAVGWDRPVPLLATHLARRDILVMLTERTMCCFVFIAPFLRPAME
jgi:hypothetical protein